jgi:ATP-dependent DNA ligase
MLAGARVCGVMPKFEFCLPTMAKAVPAGTDWFHEIKYDGYRLRLERDGARVRLITKGGYDWTKRYPLIVEAALKNRKTQFVVDGEAIIRGVDGYSDFNALHSGRHKDEVEFIAFDLLALDGEDLRKLPLSLRKINLARLLARRRTAFSSPTSSEARSGRICSERLASSASRVWCQSAPLSLPCRPLEGMDQGEEPPALLHRAGERSIQGLRRN